MRKLIDPADLMRRDLQAGLLKGIKDRQTARTEETKEHPDPECAIRANPKQPGSLYIEGGRGDNGHADELRGFGIAISAHRGPRQVLPDTTRHEAAP